MKKSKMIIIGIVTLILAICLGIFAYITYNGKQLNNKNTNKDIKEITSIFNENSSFKATTMEEVNIDFLVNKLNIEKDSVEEVTGLIPVVNVKSGMYIIIKAKDNKQQYIYSKLIEYGNDLQNQWQSYLEYEYQLVKERKIGIKNNLVYLIIAEDAKSLANSI